MGHQVDGVEVGGPRPAWADGENFVLPQDVQTVIYPEDIRVTNDQLEADRNLDTHPKAGEFDSPAEAVAAEAEEVANEPVDPTTDADGEGEPSADPASPVDTVPSAEDSEPPVVESTSDSAA